MCFDIFAQYHIDNTWKNISLDCVLNTLQACKSLERVDLREFPTVSRELLSQVTIAYEAGLNSEISQLHMQIIWLEHMKTC